MKYFREGTMFVLMLALLMVYYPIAMSAPIVQQSQQGDACREGEMSADSETSGTLWFAAGCCVGGVGVLLAYVIKPDPPASRLIGKSPEYVASFTDCYRTKAKSIQTSNAWYGCGALAVGYLIYALVVVAAATSTTNTTTY